MFDEEWQVDVTDGCTWVISWCRDAAGFSADPWRFDDEGDDIGEEDGHPCTCPYPAGGVFDCLDSIEVAMGSLLSTDVRMQLLAHAQSYPIGERDKAGWGHGFAIEISRTGPDGSITTSFAPTWATDPDSPRWDIDIW